MKKLILGGTIMSLVFSISFSASAQTMTTNEATSIKALPTTFTNDATLDIDSLQPANDRLPEPDDEVLVEYEDGDPDRPIIIGNLPNNEDTSIEEDISVVEAETNAGIDDDFGVISSDIVDLKKKIQEIVVVGSKVKNVVREAIIKGKKILENFAPTEPVTDSDGLADYAEGVAAIDDNVKKIIINDEGVQVDYRQPAKLFGFIPINMTISASVDNEGRVKIKFPWYAFFVKHTMQNLKVNLEEDIQAMNKAEPETTGIDKDAIGTPEADSKGIEHEDIGIVDPEEENAASEDGQLANIDLQNALQKQQQTLQTISNIMKTMHDTAMSLIRKIGG